jgi:hypothetical protein
MQKNHTFGVFFRVVWSEACDKFKEYDSQAIYIGLGRYLSLGVRPVGVDRILGIEQLKT